MDTTSVGTQGSPLYSTRQIFAASFIGTPAAAAWFMSLNYRALSRPEKAREMLILGGLATLVAMGAALVLPDTKPNSLWPLLYSVGIYYYARTLFESSFQGHIAAGGPRGSWWRVVGISLLFMVALVALLLVIILVLPWLAQ